MRNFLITPETTLADYLAFLRDFIQQAGVANDKHGEQLIDNPKEALKLLGQWREWAGIHARQALGTVTKINDPENASKTKELKTTGIIGQWRARKLDNAPQLCADLDEAFVQSLFDLWNEQKEWLFPEKHALSPLNILSEGESLRYFAMWASTDEEAQADFPVNERNFVSNVLKARLAEAWQNGSCGELLQHRITRTLNARCLMAYKKQEEFGKLYIEIKKSLDEQWSQGTLPDLVNEFLTDRNLALSEFLEGNIVDIEAVNQECLRVLIHLWTRPHRQPDVTSLNIQVSRHKIKEIQNEPNLSQELVQALDDIASEIIQVFVSQEENQKSRDRLLKEALGEILNSHEKEELQPHFCSMMANLRVEALRDQEKAAIWQHFLKVKIHGLIYLRSGLEPETQDWLEKHDLPELIKLIKDCKSFTVSSLRALIQDKWSACDFKKEPGTQYLETLLQSLEKRSLNPLDLSSVDAIKVLPEEFQSALKKRVDALTEKITQIKNSPMQYKIQYLNALRASVDRLQKKCLEIMGDYPRRKFERSKWHDFFKDIQDNWDFLPRSLKFWFLKCLEPNGPAALAYFSDWIHYSLYHVWQTSTTSSFVPALISEIITKKLDENVCSILIKKAQIYCFKNLALLTTAALQKKFFDYISQGWNSKQLPPVITHALGQRYLELMKNRSSKAKITNSEASELRNQAVLALLKDFNEQKDQEGELYQALSEFFEPLVFDYLNDEINSETLRACLEEFFNQLSPEETLSTHLAKEPGALETLKASFIAHFYSPGAIEIARPILKVSAIAHLEKNLSNEGQVPAQEWLELNLPCLNQAWQIPKCSEEGYFDTVNNLPLSTLEGYFPDLRKINRDLAELEALSQRPLEKVQELKLKAFEHAGFEDLLVFLKRFSNLNTLNVSDMELTSDEVKALYRAAGSPKTLIYQNAPCPTEEYETFSVEDFQGLENLDLSGSAFKAISVCQSSLVSLNLESCAALTSLSLKTQGLRVLNLNKCTALTYSELCKISGQAKITSASGLPHINADLLVEAYPVLKSYKEIYRGVKDSLLQALLENLGLKPSTFSHPKPLDEESQLQNIYKFFLNHLPDLAKEALGDKYIIFELCFLKTPEEIEEFNRTPLSDSDFAYDLALWLNHPFMLMYLAVRGEEAKIRGEKIYELIIHYLLADCAQNQTSRLAQTVVPLLGPREKFTASLAALCKDGQFPPLLFPLLHFADVNDPDIKQTLKSSLAFGAEFLLKADALEEETLREIYSAFQKHEVNVQLKNRADTVLAAGALKFPSLMGMLKEDPETHFGVLIEAGKVDDSIFEFLLETYFKRGEREKPNFLKKMASVDNPPKCFVDLFWKILFLRDHEVDFFQKIAFMGIPTQKLYEKRESLYGLCTRFFETNYYYSNDDILEKLGELDIFTSSIIPQFFKVSFSLSSIVNYLSCVHSYNGFALDEIADHIDIFWKQTQAMPARHEGICLELLKFAVRLFCKLQPGYMWLTAPQIEHPYKEWCERIDRLIWNALTKDTRPANRQPFYKEKIARIIEAELPPIAPRYKRYVSQTSRSTSPNAQASSAAARVTKLEVAVALTDLLLPENDLICLYVFGVGRARNHLRQNSVPPQINYSGHDRLRSIFYGLDYYANLTPPMKDEAANRERLLSWMQNHFRFSDVLIVNGQSSSSDQQSALLSVKVKKVNGMCLAQRPIIWLGAENPVENAFLILPTEKTPGPCFLFSREDQKEGTEKIKEYFDVAPCDISCRNLKASEFAWMFMLAAFRILDWTSTQTVFHNSEVLEFNPEWLNVLRDFFSDLAEKPEEIHVPAAERPFFNAENIENDNNAHEEESEKNTDEIELSK